MKKKDKLIVILTFVICLSLSIFSVFLLQKAKVEERQYRTKYVTSSQVSRLQYILNTLLLKTQTLEMIVVQSGGKVSDFDLIAEKLFDNDAIRSLQLAPDGVVRYIYPLKGNENGFVDLFSDPARATEAKAARDSGKLTLSGPFELYQGGLGVVGRRPIYLTGQNGEKNFWGFAIIVLDLPDAFAPAKLDTFEMEGFAYKLYRLNPDTGAIQVIDESSEEELTSPVEVSFEVPNGSWIFSVMPKDGWIQRREVLFESFISMAATFMITFIAAIIIKLRRQKEDLFQSSITDSLTGLHNYCCLMNTLSGLSREEKPYTLFFMDLNGFKKVNDTFGHDAGNQVLIESAGRLSACFHHLGDVFRNGGDEFCAVVSGSLEDAKCAEITRRIVESIEAPFTVEGKSARCGISVGYARYPADCSSMEEIIKTADNRMYLMKKGRS